MQNLQRSGSITVTCPECDQTFKTPPSRLKHGRSKYCSRKCSNAIKKRTYKGRPGQIRKGSTNPNWKGRSEKRPCPVCGIIFAKPTKTCSVACGQVLRRPHIVGDNNVWRKLNPPVIKTCEVCNADFQIRPSRQNTARACSMRCSMKLRWKSARQLKIAEALESQGIPIELEKTWDWLKSPFSTHKLRVDIFIPSHNVAIEYDGRQHKEKAFAHGRETLSKIQIRDRHKDMTVAQHGIQMIRISSWPVDIHKLIKSFDHPIPRSDNYSLPL